MNLINEWQYISIGSDRIGYVLAPTHFTESDFLQYGTAEEWQMSLTINHQLRRMEFLTGRWLAHVLQPMMPSIERDKDHGFPIWPLPYLGSISHKNGHIITAVVSNLSCRAVGIDLEHLAINPDLLDHICTQKERESIATSINKAWNLSMIAALIFSAKESLFKALFPKTKIWFGFFDAEILTIDLDKGLLLLALKKDLSNEFMSHTIFEIYFTRVALRDHKKTMDFIATIIKMT